jgi:hypothetical protein
MLFVASVIDLVADIAESMHLPFWSFLNAVSIGLSAVVAFLAGWMFLDLHLRRPG